MLLATRIRRFFGAARSDATSDNYQVDTIQDKVVDERASEFLLEDADPAAPAVVAPLATGTAAKGIMERLTASLAGFVGSIFDLENKQSGIFWPLTLVLLAGIGAAGVKLALTIGGNIHLGAAAMALTTALAWVPLFAVSAAALWFLVREVYRYVDVYAELAGDDEEHKLARVRFWISLSVTVVLAAGAGVGAYFGAMAAYSALSGVAFWGSMAATLTPIGLIVPFVIIAVALATYFGNRVFPSIFLAVKNGRESVGENRDPEAISLLENEPAADPIAPARAPAPANARAEFEAKKAAQEFDAAVATLQSISENPGKLNGEDAERTTALAARKRFIVPANLVLHKLNRVTDASQFESVKPGVNTFISAAAALLYSESPEVKRAQNYFGVLEQTITNQEGTENISQAVSELHQALESIVRHVTAALGDKRDLPVPAAFVPGQKEEEDEKVDGATAADPAGAFVRQPLAHVPGRNAASPAVAPQRAFSAAPVRKHEEKVEPEQSRRGVVPGVVSEQQ